MSLIHNRIGIVLLTAAAAVLLLGAGCQKRGYQPNSGALDQGPSATTDASGSLPTKWTEYRSDKLGITIPYPEGWYVRESGDGDQGSGTVIEFYPNEPPPESDMPAGMWFERESGTIRDALSGLNLASEESLTKNGRSLTRAEFVEDFYDPNPRVLLYLWERGGQTFQLGGPNHEIVGYAIDHMEVLP